MSGSITLKGAAELIAKFERLGGEMDDIAASALYQEAEKIMTDSKENYVPVRDNVLRSSGYVDDPEINADGISIEMGYGGAAADYAVIQHENLDFKHGGGKSAKYLEKPLMEAERGLTQRVGLKMRRELETRLRG
jgi:hypothetical protein